MNTELGLKDAADTVVGGLLRKVRGCWRERFCSIFADSLCDRGYPAESGVVSPSVVLYVIR
jgi:hypothetical protein